MSAFAYPCALPDSQCKGSQVSKARDGASCRAHSVFLLNLPNATHTELVELRIGAEDGRKTQTMQMPRGVSFAIIPEAQLILRQWLIERFGEDEAWSNQNAKALLYIRMIAFQTVENWLRINPFGIVCDRLLPCLATME